MEEARYEIVNAGEQVKQALERMPTEIAFRLRTSWPREGAGGNVITWGEYANISTDCPVVDEIVWQTELWCPQRAELEELARAVNRAMLTMGLRRVYWGPVKWEEEAGGCYHKILRFGRKVDKRTMRLID
ncbi:MAG: hypothetical protein IJD21_05510 [Oscillospiraceae bacterium]|nr:hypothetical protein [Oscillospiraceae bacterium]